MNTSHQSRKLFLAGPTGQLEAILWSPSSGTPAMASVVCHPHPLFGGTMHNKVVYNTAKSLDTLSIPVLRFNFRGAGTSAGVHDRGRGEQGDVRAALDFLANEFPGVPNAAERADADVGAVGDQAERGSEARLSRRPACGDQPRD